MNKYSTEILKEFIRESLGPEFLKNKDLRINDNPPNNIIFNLFDRYSYRDYYVILKNDTLFLKYYAISYPDSDGPIFTDIIRTSISLSDPNASEKIREFFERDPP